MTPDDAIIDQERAHENAWYARALQERFFEREGFRSAPGSATTNSRWLPSSGT